MYAFFFLLELMLDQHWRSTDLFKKCEQQRQQNDRRTDGKQNFKEDGSERKSWQPRCSFKFQMRDHSNSEDLFRKSVSDRGNKTIIGMIAIVKQVVLASKK